MSATTEVTGEKKNAFKHLITAQLKLRFCAYYKFLQFAVA